MLAEATRDWLNRRRERAIAQAEAEDRAQGREEEGAEILRLVRELNPGLVILELPRLPEAIVDEPSSRESADPRRS